MPWRVFQGGSVASSSHHHLEFFFRSSSYVLELGWRSVPELCVFLAEVWWGTVSMEK